MPILKYQWPNQHVRHASDVEWMVETCAQLGFDISESDAKMAWEAHSHMHSTHWLLLPSSGQALLDAIRTHCTTKD